MLWQNYPLGDASWEPVSNVSEDVVQDFLSPPTPPSNILKETAHVFCCKVLSTLTSSHPQTVHLPMSRAVYRHLFPCVDCNAPSHKFHDSPLTSLDSDLFPAHFFVNLNLHGQGFQVSSLSVRHQLRKQRPGFTIVC